MQNVIVDVCFAFQSKRFIHVLHNNLHSAACTLKDTVKPAKQYIIQFIIYPLLNITAANRL